MRKLFLVATLFFSVKPSHAQTFNPQLASMLQDSLDYYVGVITNVKGMSASVYLPGQGIWNGTAGLSYAGQPITSDMRFGIASNTKLFVATAMLILSESNVISLDDSLGDWVTITNPNIDPDVTIRQLLNHTSGISDPIFYAPWMDTIMANPTRVFTPNEVLGWVGAPLFPKGTSWGYSNINYILAGMVAESATGFHISQIIRDSILTPLNMDSTFYDVEEPAIGTIAHRWFNGIDYNDTSRVGLNTAGGAAGSIFSTSSEMVQWYHALMSGQVLDSASFAELTNFVPTFGPPYMYGLGLEDQTWWGHDTHGHGGSTWGYKSRTVYDPCMGAAVCGLANSHPAGMDGITMILLRVLMNHVPQCGAILSGTTTVCQGENGVTYTVTAIANATSYIWTLPNGVTGTSNTNSITVDFGLTAVSGDITVSGVNNYGQGAPTVLSVTVNPKPATPTISQLGNVLTSSAPAGNQWYDSNGLIVGATNQNYTITANDTYYVIVTLGACSSDSSNNLNAVLAGLNELENKIPFAVFPNPFSDELMIELAGQNQNVDFEILNSLGQVVLRGRLNERTTFHTAHLPNGFYTIRLMNDEGTEVKRVVKN